MSNMVVWSTFPKGDIIFQVMKFLIRSLKLEDYSNQNHDLYERNFQLLFTITIDSLEENFLDDYIALTFNCKPLSTPL